MSREKGAKAMGGMGGGGGGGGMGFDPTSAGASAGGPPDAGFGGFAGGGAPAPPPYAKPVKKGTGMQLGAKKGLGGASLLQAMAQEGEIADLGAPPPGAAAGAA